MPKSVSVYNRRVCFPLCFPLGIDARVLLQCIEPRVGRGGGSNMLIQTGVHTNSRLCVQAYQPLLALSIVQLVAAAIQT